MWARHSCLAVSRADGKACTTHAADNSHFAVQLERCAGWKLGEGVVALGDEYVAARSARRYRRQNQARDRNCRQILEAVHGDVDAPREHGLLNRLGENAFAADLGQGHVAHLIAGGFDLDELDVEAGVRRA